MVLFHVARKGGFLSFWAHRCSVTARRQFYVVASTLWCGKQNAIVTASGRLAQLVRALPSHGRGHWFESSIAHPETSDPCWSELLITAQTRPIASANYGVIERGIGFSAQPGLIWVCCPVVRWNREILVEFCFGCFVGVVVFFFGH